MSEQLALDDVRGPDRETRGPVREPKPLTERQQFVWHLIRASNGMTAEQVGAALHAQKGRHALDEPCVYCHRDGRGVLTSKALAPLVTYSNIDGERIYRVRNRADAARTAPEPVVEPTEAELASDPFAGL